MYIYIIYVSADPLPCRFEGTVYWDGLGETCGQILRVVEFQETTAVIIAKCWYDYFSCDLVYRELKDVKDYQVSLERQEER